MAKKSQRFTVNQSFIEEHTKILAADLAFYARRPVRIELVDGAHIAYTYGTDDENLTIPVVMNPNSIARVRQQQRAIALWRGIGFHELAHHLWPADEQYRLAVKEGFKSLFNLIDDEQNERRGRARDPSWGACFQSVCAFIFPGKKRKRISTGIIDDPEDEKKEPQGVEADGTYTARWNEFAFHFRRHLPGAKDSLVVKALDMIPRNFKDLSKEELFELTARVHEVLAEGVDAPPPAMVLDKPAEVPKKKPAKEEEEPETPPDDAPRSSGGVSIWRGLLRSKWAWIGFAGSILLWAGLFSTGGMDFWTQVFWIMLLILGGVTFFVIARAIIRRLAPAGPRELKPKKESWIGKAWEVVKRCGLWTLAFTLGWIPRLPIWGPVAWLWERLRDFAYYLKVRWKRFKRWVIKTYVRLMSRTWFRIMLLAFPYALFLVMFISVIFTTGETNWWLALILALLLLLATILAWLFRERIKDFLTREFQVDSDLNFAINIDIPRDKETLEFNVLSNVQQVDADAEFLDGIMPEVLPLSQQLRPELEKCGRSFVDVEDQEDGYNITEDLERLRLGEINLMVDEQEAVKTSIHIEVGLDCSTSMMQPTATLEAGEKFALGKWFALVIENAIRGLRGASSHFWGFNDRVIFDCGEAGFGRISGLKCSGGNNDSAMLWHMAQSAAESGKDLKILLLISDGMPSDCPWGSLHNLGLKLESDGMIPVQVGVDQIDDPALKRFFVDLVGQQKAEAIITMGRVLVSLIDEGN